MILYKCKKLKEELQILLWKTVNKYSIIFIRLSATIKIR